MDTENVQFTKKEAGLLEGLFVEHLEGCAAEELSFFAGEGEEAARAAMEEAPVLHLPTLLSIGKKLGVDVTGTLLLVAKSYGNEDAMKRLLGLD
jgi:hypothetical protein